MRFHIVGIGGAGMSAIARLLLGRGNVVSGSDSADWPLSRAVAREGATVFARFDPSNIAGAEILIRSSAYREDHPEIVAARAAGIPVWRRQDAWMHLAEGRRVVAVAGTHGKTTTTALVFTALRAGGLDPSLICGAELRDLGSNAHAGRGEHLVIEADEYDRAFLSLHPEIAVVTNVEHDHVDHFPRYEDVVEAFREFVSRVTPGGAVVACADDSGARVVATWARHHMGWPVETYGTDAAADWRVEAVTNVDEGTAFRLRAPTQEAFAARLRLLGAHNARNATAAVVTAARCGVAPSTALSALATFGGTSRRLETLGEARGVTVIDDYAHHPTEIRASIDAVRPRVRHHLVVVFQPHTPSRLRAFFDDFAAALRTADAAIVVETFASAREAADGTAGARELAGAARGLYAATNEEAAALATKVAQDGDLVLVLGAGDVRDAGERILETLA